MAGIFGFFDFTKPGKGVDADEPAKRAPVRYAELLGRNLWRFMVLNLAYAACLLPIILAFHYYFFDPLVEYTVNTEIGVLQTSPVGIIFSFVFGWPEPLLWIAFMLAVVMQGPLTCGLTYCLRNAVREEHYWRSDFWARARMNFKQGVALGLIDAVVFYMAAFNVNLFFTGYAETDGFSQALIILSLMVFPLYMAIRATAYTQIVTFELTIPQILRNSFILALAGFPRHLLNSVICTLIFTAVLLLNGWFELVLLPLLGFILIGYTTMFITWPLVKKHLVEPIREQAATL